MRTGLIAAGLGLAAAGYAAGQAAKPVAKGYIVAEITVTDPAAYEEYKPKAAALIARHGGRYLMRGGPSQPLEGAAPAGRFVTVEFDSVAKAVAFYRSPEYQAVSKIRQRASTSRFFVVEGVAL